MEEQQAMMVQDQVQWADPGSAGGLLIACLCTGAWALFSGQVPASCAPVFSATIFGFGVALLIVAVICFKRGDMIGGTLNIVFGSVFGFAAGISGITRFALPYFMGSVTKGTMTLPALQIGPQLDGYFILMAVLALLLMAILIARITWFLFAWVIVIAVAFALAAIWMILGSPGITNPMAPIQNDLLKISGWLFLICGISMLYFAMASIINTASGKMVLPIGGPLIKS